MTTAPAQNPPVSMKALLEAGVHFGHQTRRWDPRMKPYIYMERNGIHIIDLQQTVPLLRQAMDFARSVAARGEAILFVGTKKQAQESIQQEATRCGMPYVTNRWLGGTLTNFQTIERRIDDLLRLEDQQQKGEFGLMIKKEAGKLMNKMEKMNRYFGGIKSMRRLPGALFIVDPPMERIAVTEALRMRIPIIAMCDTNCNPDEIDYPIPSNDDAIRAVKLIASRIADAALEGRELQGYASEAEDTEGLDVESLAAGGRFSASPDDPGPQVTPAEPEAGAAAQA
ncbi:MAG TPA: 30S ribosomal protein S2 [Dehalococcoidia bacterium]|jgi:small subunit ribosomal protein S2|nr:30S ribosomal protein S2 [Dehalococcoidia bacterium]